MKVYTNTLNTALLVAILQHLYYDNPLTGFAVLTIAFVAAYLINKAERTSLPQEK